MAIKEPGGITPTGDAENQRVQGISNVAKTVNEMQRTTDADIAKVEAEIQSNKDMQEIQSSMNGVLRKLSDTVGALSTGVKSVTMSTARATQDAISQYGRAIGEDISFKKQNVVAMALARSTPIFGYFAAKFMETDVFKKAATKMREQVSKAFSGVANIFRRGKSAKEESAIPHMQKGGIVEKGGLARLHPAEVVMPIDDLLKRIDENMSTTRQLALVARKAQLQSLGNMGTFVQAAEKKQRIGIMKGFLRAYAEVNSQYLEPDSKRQLRALLAIQDALGAQIGTWKQVWQKMLIEHPFFRNFMFLTRSIQRVFTSPFKMVATTWKARGGYQRILSKARQPMVATAETLGSFAMENLWRLDNVSLYTRLTAQATQDMAAVFTGKRYPAVKGLSQGWWRFTNLLTWPLGKAYKKAIAEPLIKGTRRAILGKDGERQHLLGLADYWTKERDVTKLPGFWRIRREQEIAAGTKESLPGLPSMESKLAIKVEPYMLEYYKYGSRVFHMLYDRLPDQYKLENRQLKLIEANTEVNEEANRRQKRQGMMKWIIMAGGFLKTMLGGLLGNLFKPLTSMAGMFTKAGLLTAMSSPAAFAKFLGPVAGVMGAGALGYGLGTIIERSLIAPIRERHFAELDRAKLEAGKGAAKTRSEMMEARARVQAGKGSYRDKELMKMSGKMQGQLGALTKARKGFIQGGFMERLTGGQDVLNIVTAAQTAYFGEHIDDYLPYSVDEVSRIRAQFTKHAKGAGIDYAADPVKAGRRREEMFLAYLKKHGSSKYLGIEDIPITFGEKTGIKYRDVKTQVMDMTEGALDKARIVKTGAETEVAKLKIHSQETLKNIDKMAERVVEGGKQQTAAISNMSTSFVTNMNNSMANSVSHGRTGLTDMQEDLTARILHGRMH